MPTETAGDLRRLQLRSYRRKLLSVKHFELIAWVGGRRDMTASEVRGDPADFSRLARHDSALAYR